MRRLSVFAITAAIMLFCFNTLVLLPDAQRRLTYAATEGVFKNAVPGSIIPMPAPCSIFEQGSVSSMFSVKSGHVKFEEVVYETCMPLALPDNQKVKALYSLGVPLGAEKAVLDPPSEKKQ